MAFTGHDREIDLALIDIRRDDRSTTRHAYVVMAGLGLDAKMLANTNDDLKKKVGWLAYISALLTAMGDTNELQLRYNTDGTGNHSVRAHTIIIGNCGRLPADILLLPDAAIDNEMLEIVLLRPQGVIGWLQITAKII
jgi:diacylglycerol kinase family enzyme